ncbi:MAG: hypothetical protein R3B49_10575 [Phycisphaerales bacterium]
MWEAAQLVTREKQCGDVFVPGSIECLSTMHVAGGVMSRLVKQAGDAGALFRHENGSGDAVEGTRRLFRWGVVDVLGPCTDEHACGTCPLEPECAGRAKARPEGDAGHVSVNDAIRLKRRVGKSTWDAEMLCRRPRRTDCVLPEFDPAAHIVGDLPPERDGWQWIGGVDFGIRAPTVVLWGAVDVQGVLRIVDERVVAGETLERHAEAVRAAPWPELEWLGVDPAGDQRSLQSGISDAEALRRLGFEVRARRLAIARGLELVRARLRPADGPVRLLIHARCEKLIESLERYRYPAHDPESTTPIKDGSDHAVDALRYMVQNLDMPYRTARGRYR